MPYRLVSADGQLSFELRAGSTLVLGRALSSDLPVLDPTVSRRHAEVVVEATGVALRDLESSNGTFVNGKRVASARVVAGDRVVFGKILFELRDLSPVLIDDGSAETMRRAARAGTTIIRQVPVPDADQTLERALRASGVQRTVDETAVVVPQQERDRLKLTLLLEISKALTRVPTEAALLEQLLGFTCRMLDVDQAAVLLTDGDGDLRVGAQRARSGPAKGHGEPPVPISLAQTAVREKVALLSDDHPVSTPVSGTSGPSDEATTIPMVSMRRSAVCAPLLGGEGRVLGVLYAASLSAGDRPVLSRRVDEDDLEFLVACAGIGAVALENLRFAERSRQEAVIRGNFERFFTPHLAAKIAATPAALRAGGERRRVAVLFNDIRGFTPLAARLTPDATARLLTEYFSEMAECVFRHGGTLDKFIGDAVMAQWGAPWSAPDDADRALEAALEMLSGLERLNRRWAAEGRPVLQVGVGLNYGEVFAGYLGSERRLEYTIIGDVVNTANRLCQAAEGGQILVTPAVAESLTRPHTLVSHEALWVPGRDTPLPVYNAAS
jgi:adenylate cyclase